MNKRDKMRYLKKVVLYCLAFTSLVVVAGLVICWRTGNDPTGVVTAAIGFFGAELALSCLTKIFADNKGGYKRENQLETEADQPQILGGCGHIRKHGSRSVRSSGHDRRAGYCDNYGRFRDDSIYYRRGTC